jgi:hypothetical protein
MYLTQVLLRDQGTQELENSYDIYYQGCLGGVFVPVVSIAFLGKWVQYLEILKT